MVLFCDAGLKHGRHYTQGLLILAIAYLPFSIGQQVGVSLKLFGVTISNNSLVDIDDILYRAPIGGFREIPTNANGLHDLSLVCVTDLEDCCESPRTVQGDWYYPDGNVVSYVSDQWAIRFQRNRGPNEVINGRQFYGSVRLFRQWSNPPGRGRFRCELPSAADPNVAETLYVNIVDFDRHPNPVTLTPSGPGVAGNTFTLTCSVRLISPISLPANVPSPTFEWFYGPQGNASLPSGVTPTATVRTIENTYSSTLQFSPTLNESHAGMYTCRLGAGHLVNSTVVVGTVEVTPSGALTLGQSSYTLTCRVLVTGYFCPTITYQWTKNNGTAIQLGSTSNTLSFTPLKLSDTGQYTCSVTISSPSLISDATVMGSHDIRIQIPAPTSALISSSTSNPVRPIGSTVTLRCTVHVELSPAVDVPVTVNIVWIGQGEFLTDFVTTNTSQTFMQGITTYTSTLTISSLGRNQSGIYECNATLHSATNTTYMYIINSVWRSDFVQVTTGVYLALRNQLIANNSQINIRNIGLPSDNPNSALQCITDKKPCCLSPGLGEWYLPNGAVINNETTSATMYYSSRGDNGEVIMNRPYNATSPTGRFCCVVPDASHMIQTLCVTLNSVLITPFQPSTTAIAGENYTIECSTSGVITAFEWLGPPDGRTPVTNSSSLIIISTLNSTMSQLQFRPLQQSQNGSYSCRATTDEDTLLSEPTVIRVNAPMIAIQIIENTDRDVPIAGEDYDLICSILGAENLNPIITYQWMKNSDSSQIGTSSNTLSLTPARISDAGNEYSCSVTIASSYLSGNIAAVVPRSHTVRIQMPTPSLITLTSSKVNSIHIIGSDVTLTCMVKLKSSILGTEIFLLMVDVQLSKDGTPLALTGPTVIDTTFTYTTQLNSFGESDFGNYNCTATIRPLPSLIYLTGTDILSDTLTITAFVPSPVDVRAIQSSPSAPVEIRWSPPTEGANSITGYRIFYGNGQNASIPPVAIGIMINESYSNQSVFLRSEAGQLFSELISVLVEKEKGACDMELESSSDSSEAGTAIGVSISVVCLGIIVTIIIAVLCWWRSRLSYKSNIAVTANMAYEDVNFMPEGGQGNDNLEMDLKPAAHDQCLNEAMLDSMDDISVVYETISCVSQPAAGNSDTNDTEGATTAS